MDSMLTGVMAPAFSPPDQGLPLFKLPFFRINIYLPHQIWYQIWYQIGTRLEPDGYQIWYQISSVMHGWKCA